MPKYIPLNNLIKTTKDLESKSKDLSPAMAHITNTLQTTTSEVFENERSPFGQKMGETLS